MAQSRGGAKKKITLYLPRAILDETRAEARRLDRTISWIMQSAWRHARQQMKELPSATLDDEAEVEAS